MTTHHQPLQEPGEEYTPLEEQLVVPDESAGPLGVAAGAAAGALVERAMHGAAGHEHFEGDENHWAGDHDHTGDDDGHGHQFHYDLGFGRDRDRTDDEIRRN